MWFNTTDSTSSWADAARHLAKSDRKLGHIIDRVGPCTLSPRRDYFPMLCKSIFSQQLSTKVAATLVGRFRGQFPRRLPTPALVQKLLTAGDADAIKKCGLSRQKAGYLLDLSNHFLTNRIATRRLRAMDDEEVIEMLTSVKGIGRWTAEMFLIFVLNRTDLLPVDDLGLREGVREIYKLAARPTSAELTEMAKPWRPYRSIATWYIWRRDAAMAKETTARKQTLSARRPRECRELLHTRGGLYA